MQAINYGRLILLNQPLRHTVDTFLTNSWEIIFFRVKRRQPGDFVSDEVDIEESMPYALGPDSDGVFLLLQFLLTPAESYGIVTLPSSFVGLVQQWSRVLHVSRHSTVYEVKVSRQFCSVAVCLSS